MSDHPREFKAGLLTSMYLCQTISLGFVFGSLPVIMRQLHMPLKGIGALFILHLPWAIKFLWAPWVDRIYIPSIGRRRTWIFPLQWLGAVLLLCVSFTPPETHFSTMYLILLLLNMVMATNDIAVDGYATDILYPEERPWGNTIQAGARFAGMMMGGGLMLFLYSFMSWKALCIFLAGAAFLLSLPIFFHREIPPVREEGQSDKKEKAFGILAFLRRDKVYWLIAVLIASTTFAFTGFQMRMPVLADLGLCPKEIGTLLMSFAYPAGLTGTAVSGWLLYRTGNRIFLRCFCMISIILAGFTAICGAKHSMSLWQAGLILSLDNILIGAIHVWAFTIMMRVSAGHQSGTGFAVLSSLFIIFPLATAPAFGAVGDHLGVAGLYTLLVFFTLAGFVVSEIIIQFRVQSLFKRQPGQPEDKGCD